jgi:bifunctional DNA-binding transcriptional regulator/antitoxin component of YhaV-PrlF toxin-antitoxin module
MRSIFIVSISEGLKLDCLYYGYKKESVIRNYQEIKQGDILEITNQGKFIIGIGWYILIVINNQEKVYVSIRELEHAMETKEIQSFIEIELEQHYLTIQLDNALDSGNKELFMKVSEKYIKHASLKEKSIKTFTLHYSR